MIPEEVSSIYIYTVYLYMYLTGKFQIPDYFGLFISPKNTILIISMCNMYNVTLLNYILKYVYMYTVYEYTSILYTVYIQY